MPVRLKSIFINGMPTFLNNVASRITNILFNYLLLYLGGVSAVSVYGILMSIVTSSILFFFTDEIASLFIIKKDETFIMAIPALIIYATTYLTRWFSFAIQSFMSAIGKFSFATIISLCVSFIFPIISIPILWNLKLTGLWLNSSITSMLTGIISILLLKKLLRNFKQKNI